MGCSTSIKISEIFKNGNISLKLLSMKLVTLLALVTGQRCQTLTCMNIPDLELSDTCLKIRIKTILKQSKPNSHLSEIFIEEFKLDEDLCVIKTMNMYLEKTEQIRNNSELFLTTLKPHRPASKSTIATWIKCTLKLAGIDMSIFSAHSTRGASASAAINRVPIDTVMRTAGWKRECTFRTFYNKPITNDGSYGTAILSLA